MNLEEFYEEAKQAVPRVDAQVVEDFRYDDEVLPINVIKTFIQGRVVYMKLTDDGRMVRMDDYNL